MKGGICGISNFNNGHHNCTLNAIILTGNYLYKNEIKFK